MPFLPRRPLLARRMPLAVAVALAAALAVAMPGAAAGWVSASRAYSTHQAVAHDVAVEPTGTVHVATEGGASPGIWYATRVGSSWQRMHVTTGDDHDPSIALDGTGVVIVFRRAGSGAGTWLATNVAGDGWVTFQLPGGAGGGPSLVVSDGTAFVAVAIGGALKLLRGPDDVTDATAWTSETIDGTCCTGIPSMALGSDGQPRVAYSDGVTGNPGGLSVSVRGTGGGWTRTSVDSHRVSAPALSVDGTKAYIAFVRRGAGTWLASLSGSTWSFRQVDSGANGPPDVSAFSGSIALVFGNTGALRFATLSGGIIFSSAFSTTAGVQRPHIVRAGGKPYVTYLVVNGGSKDGVWQTRQS